MQCPDTRLHVGPGLGENAAVLCSSPTRVPSVNRKDLPHVKLRFVFACILLLAPIASAFADNSIGPPQIIDRDVIFGNPEIAAAQLSPNGRWAKQRLKGQLAHCQSIRTLRRACANCTSAAPTGHRETGSSRTRRASHAGRKQSCSVI